MRKDREERLVGVIECLPYLSFPLGRDGVVGQHKWLCFASFIVLYSSTCLESVPNLYSVESAILPNALRGQGASHREKCSRLPIKESSPVPAFAFQAAIRALIWEPQSPALVAGESSKKSLLSFTHCIRG